jgi:hypothetical protein
MREDEQQPKEREEPEASVLSAREAMPLISRDPATASDPEGAASDEDTAGPST